MAYARNMLFYTLANPIVVALPWFLPPQAQLQYIPFWIPSTSYECMIQEDRIAGTSARYFLHSHKVIINLVYAGYT